MPRKRPAQRLNAMLNVRIRREQLDQLEATADQLGVEMAVLVRHALELGVGPAAESIERSIEDAAHGTANA